MQINAAKPGHCEEHSSLSCRGRKMTSLDEFRSRASLCRQLATREPHSEQIWLAEAARWSQLAQDKIFRCPDMLDLAAILSLPRHAVRRNGRSISCSVG